MPKFLSPPIWAIHRVIGGAHEAYRQNQSRPKDDAARIPADMPESQPTTEHAAILAALEETARLGHVPADALIGRLHACLCDRLAQDRQQLVALEQELENHLVRLDARFPVPQPEPEKPTPVRSRRFGPISRDLRGTAPGTETRQ